MPAYEGRLELTWTNKSLRLLAHEDGSYEWVQPSDYRVAEVRLLHSTEAVGEADLDEKERARDNLLIQGDALNALTSLAELPEFASEYLGKVKLVYIDPPFNTQQSFLHYDDALEHSVWLTMMRDRLLQVRELLAPEGTVWLHLDDSEVHRARCVLDEVFGPSNYLATVIWQRTSAKSLARRTMGTMHESILVYGASEAAELQTLYVSLDDDKIARKFTHEDERGRYHSDNLTAGSYRPHLDSGKPWRGFDPSERNRCWAVSRAPLLEAGLTDQQLADMTMRYKLDALDAAGYIHWPPNGGFPRFKRYLHHVQGVAVGDLWTDINVINSQAVERSGFATQKPEALIQRILEMASDEGDIVLDCFLGSGTTAAVAHKMRRRWIGVEREQQTITNFAQPRLTKVVNGADAGGITEAVDWNGGGGYRVLDVAPSMFDASHEQVFLSDWATNGKLAEVTAAQLHYDFAPDPPFCARRGRARLAVVDGLVNGAVVRLLVDALTEGERLVVCGTAIDPQARTILKDLLPGSSVRKIPQSILRDYRQTARTAKIAPDVVAAAHPITETRMGTPA